ncbi:MAG: TIGR00269 family protein [Candidatus Pacearchaeota archaeon]
MSERSVKNFIRNFEERVRKTIQEYELCSKNDKIVVACSGGKDSTTVLYLLNKFGYNVSALHINLLMGKWSEQNLANVKKFCEEQGIKLHVYSIRDEIGYGICYVKSVVQQKAKLKQCSICGVIRRWLINKKARQLGATKLATGHNLDDEAQTIIMNILRGDPYYGLGLGPITGVINDKKFVTRIKPLYWCKEVDVKQYSQLMNFPVLYQRCPCVIGATRHEVRNKLNELEKINLDVKKNIVKNFLKIKESLKKSLSNEKINYCKSCGEPSRNAVCKACQLLQLADD